MLQRLNCFMCIASRHGLFRISKLHHVAFVEATVAIAAERFWVIIDAVLCDNMIPFDKLRCYLLLPASTALSGYTILRIMYIC